MVFQMFMNSAKLEAPVSIHVFAVAVDPQISPDCVVVNIQPNTVMHSAVDLL